MQRLLLKVVFFGTFVLTLTFEVGSCTAREPGWKNQVITVGPLREELESLPIEKRPYRPLHFYGNTVRRRYHRGRLRPTISDLRQTIRSLASAR
jgi:hypothetical protein